MLFSFLINFLYISDKKSVFLCKKSKFKPISYALTILYHFKVAFSI